MDYESAKKANRRNWMNKGHKTQNQHARNQIVHTIQQPAKNESALESRKKGYES